MTFKLMPYTPHSLFEAPSEDTKIWRFTDFPKFSSMLLKSSLYFSRLDKLGDPFEGHITRARIEQDEKEYGHPGIDDHYKESIIRFHKHPIQQRKNTFVNCWHMGEHESELLWSRYSFMAGGIAIQSSFDRLVRSLREYPQGVYIGKMKYAVWENEITPIVNVMHPLLLKRINYQDERELRAASTYFQHLKKNPRKVGFHLPINLMELIETIFISPKSKGWFLDLVKSMLEKYDLKIPVKKSIFSEKPYRPKFLERHPMYT